MAPTAGIIYHFKDPLNASHQSDQSPEFLKTHVKIFGFADLPPENRCHRGERGSSE